MVASHTALDTFVAGQDLAVGGKGSMVIVVDANAECLAVIAIISGF